MPDRLTLHAAQAVVDAILEAGAERKLVMAAANVEREKAEAEASKQD